MKCIYVLLTQDLFQSSGVATYGWLAGLFDALPGYGIQFNFVPPRDAETYAKRLLDEGLAGGMLSAVVLLGCPRVVQEQAFHHGAPALVLGTDYSSTRQLPSVDADQFETGRLAAEYLVEKGHRRIAILMREMWFPGDQRMFEGVGRALDDAGLGHDALTLCNLSLDAPALNADLQRLLTGEDRPTGCVCRTPFFARAAVQAAESLGLAVPGDLEIICDGLDRQAAASLGLPSVCMKMGVEEQVAIGGRMLAQLFEGRQPDPLHVVLPVELVAPKRPENGRLKPNRRRRSAVSRKTK
jgi:LacI family transcriptional regulator